MQAGKEMAVIKQRIRRIESFLSLCDQSAGAKPPPRRLQTVQDLIDLLEEQTEAVRAAPWASPLDKARAIAYLAVRAGDRAAVGAGCPGIGSEVPRGRSAGTALGGGRGTPGRHRPRWPRIKAPKPVRRGTNRPRTNRS